MMWDIIYIGALTSFSLVYCSPLVDVTNDIGLQDVNGVIAAFGDFDSDRDTDLFVISEKGDTLNIYLWTPAETKYKKSTKAFVHINSGIISNVAPADFNGDGCVDVLLSVKMSDHVAVYIYWSDQQKLQKGSFRAKMKDQPLVMDYNGDFLPDLFGTTFDTSKRSYWVANVLKSGGPATFILHTQNATAPLALDAANAFVDLNGDHHPDLIAVSRPNGNIELKATQFEVWLNKNGILTKDSDIGFPTDKDVTVMGQMSFADLDADGSIDIILPLCESDKSITIFVYTKNKWRLVLSTKLLDWKCPLPDKADKKFKFPFVIRMNDFNMDTYPDGITIVNAEWEKPVGHSIAVLENIECVSTAEMACNWERTFQLTWKLPAGKFSTNPVLFGMLDFYDNGISDFLIVEPTDNNSGYKLKALKNEYNVETTFLKISVLSGRCYKECTCHNSHTPYGAIQLGAMVEFISTDSNGNSFAGAAVQFPKSSHFSLEQPFVSFGLGRTPNFVDRITVGIAQEHGKINRIREWQSLIPNSQVIVIPYPPDNPSEWMTKLLVTPSKLVLQTGGVLLGTCLLVAGLILILHVKEKREDDKEKRQDAHKFHFDAL